ncbi:hypothetical protein KBC99_03050 [Candidatus Saccharibacteria bacterium]|nr:hypothetical protein [Candidatus Saccharibacteria bacterium]
MKISKGDDFLGEQIDIIFDRPLGSTHPKHKAMICPVNYRYVPDAQAGNGDPVDVYYLSSEGQVKRTKDTCIGYVDRWDDNGEKLIATDGDMHGVSGIEKLLSFQEKWFDHEIILMSDKK